MRDFAIGFDLDMTLVDSADAIADSLVFAAARHGALVTHRQARAVIGLPLDQIIPRWLPSPIVDQAIADYRDHYARHGLPATKALPGAAQALRTVSLLGGRSVVVSAKQTHQAEAAMRAAGLAADVVEGGRFGAAKASLLTDHGVAVYVGDHVGDMAAARLASVVAVGLTSNVHNAAELAAAGADVVLSGIAETAQWLPGWCLARREAALLREIAGYGSVVVAFSGGADSALLLAAAARALGRDRVRAVTAVSASLADGELADARRFSAALGVAHDVIRTRELDSPGYRANGAQRCHFCKSELLDQLQAHRQRIGFAVCATGTNTDDARSAFRPGVAAAAARGARAPLADAGLTKQQVRELSRAWGLTTWDRPAKACLASRIRYGIEVTPHRLARVDRAERAAREALREAGIAVRDLRVRDRGDHATLEVDAALVEQVGALPGLAAALVRSGFRRVEVDPAGFRSGSLNEELPGGAR